MSERRTASALAYLHPDFCFIMDDDSMECAGIRDVLTKTQGTHNPHNVVKATLAGLRDLGTIDRISTARRGMIQRRKRTDG